MKDEKLYTLFRNFIFEVSPLIDPILEKLWIKPYCKDYPVLNDYKENGMPNISTNSHFIHNINDLFRSWTGKPDIDLASFESYNLLKDYLLVHEKHLETIYPDDIEIENRQEIYEPLILSIIRDVLERYYLLNKTKQENEDLLKDIYTPVENFIYNEYLHFDISIPILFLQFEEDEITISENVIVRKIPDDYQRARYSIRSYSSPIADALINSATHEVIFKNYYIKRIKRYVSSSLDYESAYPITKLELFFNAIKIATNNNSGFAQMLVYPHNWVDHYNTDLPRVKGLTVRKYPNYFDDYYWTNKSFPIINTDDTQKISSVYNKLIISENNKIQIANKRLRLSYMRDNEEDSILDIIIALETLLGDNNKGEITHKLSLRLAKLISLYSHEYDAIQVFDSVKKIYDYRSSIVHGSTKSVLNKEIKLHKEAQPINTIQLSNNYLREILGILLQHPNYLDPKEIDKLLLL